MLVKVSEPILLCEMQLEIPTSSNHNWIARTNRTTGKAFMVKADKAKDYEKRVSKVIAAHKPEFLAMPPDRAVLFASFELNIRESQINRKDWTNYVKLLEDCVMKGFGLNDHWVRHVDVDKYEVLEGAAGEPLGPEYCLYKLGWTGYVHKASPKPKAAPGQAVQHSRQPRQAKPTTQLNKISAKKNDPLAFLHLAGSASAAGLDKNNKKELLADNSARGKARAK